MIKVFAGQALEYTPFTISSQINLLSQQGIVITSQTEADLIVCGTFKKILPLILKHGSKKKYLIWTAEPRYDTHFATEVQYPFLPKIHIMNVYTGTYTNNYIWTPERSLPPLTNFSAFKTKKIVALMTYKASHKWKFERNGVNFDLANLRTQIALEGSRKGVLDIYGKNWPTAVAVGESRNKDWRLSKPAILQKYHFNLCFENTVWSYYCTEKIWDAIQEGCLPIYYGKGSTIYQDFPADSFLDYCNFKSFDGLFDYIQKMTVAEYQERMNLCITAFNQAVKRKQEINPQSDLIARTAQRIQEIRDEI